MSSSGLASISEVDSSCFTSEHSRSGWDNSDISIKSIINGIFKTEGNVESRSNVNSTVEPMPLSAINLETDLNHTINGQTQISEVENIELNASSSSEARKLGPTCYFDDGKRIIDFILVYKLSQFHDTAQENKPPEEIKKTRNRKNFEEKLLLTGIDVEHECDFNNIHYLKLHGTWSCLAKQAEIMQLTAPLRENMELKHHRWVGSKLLRKLFKRDPFEMPTEYRTEERVYYSSRFDQRRMEIFMNSDKENFFTPIQRIRMVNEILKTTSIGNYITKSNNEIPMNLDFLLEDGTYLAAYPLHDSNLHNSDKDFVKKRLPYRQWLKDIWATPTTIYQPIPQIRAYFGEKIAMYFALVGLLSKKLTVPAILATACFIAGLITATNDDIVKDICNSQDYFCRMCPKLACPLISVNSSCGRAIYMNACDNWTLVFFAVFICFWGIYFLENWKRTQSELAAFWDAKIQISSDNIRLDYLKKANKMAFNPASGVIEPKFSSFSKASRWVITATMAIFFISLLFCFLFGIIMYRMVIYGLLIKATDHSSGLQIAVYFSASFISAIIIAIMETIYRKIALWLTTLECPVTDEEFERIFIWKFMSFQFVNNYGQLAYLGFLKGQFAGAPHTQSVFTDRCSPLGCYIEANIHFITLIAVKEIIYMIKIYFEPKLHSLRSRSWSNSVNSRWENDFKLKDFPEVGISHCYEDLVILYGFIVLFGSLFPIATILVLLYLLLKLRLDANHILSVYKRPVPEVCDSIGVWCDLLELLTQLATLSNALIIAFTSQYIDRVMFSMVYSIDGSLDDYLDFIWCGFDTADYTDPLLRFKPNSSTTAHRYCQFKDYRYNYDTPNKYDRREAWWEITAARLAFILAFEHLIIAIQNLMEYFVDDQSENTKLQSERRKLLEKRAYVFCEKEESRKKLAESLQKTDGSRRSSNIIENKHRRKEILEACGPSEFQQTLFGQDLFKKVEAHRANDNPFLRRKNKAKQPLLITIFKWLNVYCRS